MKIAALIARVLLGLMFLVFGLNMFHTFLHMPMPTGPAGEFMGILFGTHYIYAVAALEVVGGILLLSGYYLPLGLTLLGPVIVNILLYHITMQPAGIMPGLVATVLWFIVFAWVRSAFRGVLAPRTL